VSGPKSKTGHKKGNLVKKKKAKQKKEDSVVKGRQKQSPADAQKRHRHG